MKHRRKWSKLLFLELKKLLITKPLPSFFLSILNGKLQALRKVGKYLAKKSKGSVIFGSFALMTSVGKKSDGTKCGI